jgi:uncharacterized protein (TIGR01777 family)
MHVLITGATGLIGSSVAEALLARGDEVVGLTRNPDGARETNPNIAWHSWDPARERPSPDALAGVEAVVNLVGEPLNQRWTEPAKKKMRASRVTATNNLVQGFVFDGHRPKVLVSQSAVGYYGDGGSSIIDETAAPAMTFDAQLCVDWEAAAREAEASGMRVVVLRTGLVLDKRGGLLKELLTPFKLGLGGPLAGGRQYTPWIALDDEVGMILWALDNNEVTGTLNATGPEPVTNREFSETLGRLLGRPAFLPTPKIAIRMLYGRELAVAATGGQRALPRRARDLGYQFKYWDVESALRAALEAD